MKGIKHIRLKYKDKHNIPKEVFYVSVQGGFPTEVFHKHAGRIKEIISMEEVKWCQKNNTTVEVFTLFTQKTGQLRND